ncbi:hypothetical protein L2E82_51282 [Cichorium intybus]|nr:hypothetical protein L2E82_51282 [Cichorium intybus]
MADKPSRRLVLHGDRLARFVNPSHNQLHALAAQLNVDGRTLGEFLNLVDAYEDYSTLSAPSQDKRITPPISER